MGKESKEKLTLIQVYLPDEIARAVKVAAALDRQSLRKYIEKKLTDVIRADTNLKALNLL